LPTARPDEGIFIKYDYECDWREHSSILSRFHEILAKG
jgi:hypothetical protein